MMGSGEQGVPICSTTLRVCTCRLWTLNGIASPIVPTGTIQFALASKVCAQSSSGSGRSTSAQGAGFLAEAELTGIAPHAVENDDVLTGNGNTGASHAAVLGDLQAPCPQAGPLPAA